MLLFKHENNEWDMSMCVLPPIHVKYKVVTENKRIVYDQKVMACAFKMRISKINWKWWNYDIDDLIQNVK